MSDTIYFLILVTVSVCVVVASIYRVLSKRRHSKKEKQGAKSIPPKTVQNMEKEFDDDVITNPAYSFSKLNIFHKDRHDE